MRPRCQQHRPPRPRPVVLSLLVVCAIIIIIAPGAVAWVAAPQPRLAPPSSHRLYSSSADGSPEKHHQQQHSRSDALRVLLGSSATAAAVASTLGFGPAGAGAVTVGGGGGSSSIGGGGKEGEQRTYREKGRPALLEGLVYLPKGVNYWGEILEGGEEGADPATGAEALFLTASYEGRLVLGARVPMQGIMFPFLAQFYPGNIIPGPGKSAQATWEAVKDKDLVVRARVCATGEYPPCETPLLRAASLSKFLPEVRDPNNSKSSGSSEAEPEVIARNVRIGASLMLRPPGEATTLEEMRKVGTMMTGGSPRQ